MKIHLQWIGILGLLFWLGCEKAITIDLPDHEPELVVNSFFSPDSVWRARVTASQAINAPYGLKEITDATVLILENGVPVDTLVHDAADAYVSLRGRKPVADHSYTLRASAPGYPEVQGSDMTPRLVIPNNIAFQDSVQIDAVGQYQSKFSFTIQDWPGQHNYYILDMYKIYYFTRMDSISVSQVHTVNIEAQDPILDAKTSIGQVFFDDATFDGQLKPVEVAVNSFEHLGNDTIYARLSVVSESYYRYAQSMAKYRNAQFDFFAEPVRIYSNMTPGMGIFAGRAGWEMMIP
jgi:Domain of unknown function (DUF4249)